jgi:hypothetical protein
MKTFFWIYVGAQLVMLSIWLVLMFGKPAWQKAGKSRFAQNWDDGGYLLLIGCVVVAIVISVGLTKLVLWFNFLEG